jgi:hypothetical protein
MITAYRTETGNNGDGTASLVVTGMPNFNSTRPQLLIVVVAMAGSEDVSSITLPSGLVFTQITSLFVGGNQIEIWRAYKRGALTEADEELSIALTGVVRAAAVVTGYTGINTVGEDGASAIGKVFSASGTSTNPTLTVTPTKDSGLLVAAVSGLLATTITAGAGETITGQDAATTSPNCAQARSDSSSQTNISQTISFTLTSSVNWNEIVLELVPEHVNVRPCIITSNVSMRVVNKVVAY